VISMSIMPRFVRRECCKIETEYIYVRGE